MSDTRYLVVRTTEAYAHQVQAYLYRTAELLPQRVSQDARRTVLLVKVTDTDARVQSTAQYQADRLSSGGHYSAVHNTLRDAVQDMASALLDTLPLSVRP